ncbi:hypothetical protein BT69DRAFT_1319876 [Atractiella rhizophila]|nr:hypothetical protein BT69DRAFT_1319876 [Atractiella rhizophila]
MALLRELESERLMKQRRLSHHRKRSLLPRWRGKSLGGTESAWSWYEDPLEDDTPVFEQNSSAVKPVVQDVSQMLLGSVSMEKRLRRRDILSPPAENISIPTLECHAPLHTNPLLQPFNQPVWMATDARHPAEDENIAKFYATFPCLFTFNDMAQLDHPLGEEVRQIADWKNMEDNGAKIGGFMIPILDSVTAARARLVYPTYGSTFGYYAANQLTQNYRHDPY